MEIKPNLEKPPIKIELGSTSVHKREALQDACNKLGLKIELGECAAESGINAQPFGFDETYRGASNRAKEALAKNPESAAVGIESGIIPVGDSFIDLAIVVLLLPDGREFTSTSAGVEFPKEAVEAAKLQGFETTTVGSIIAKTMGGLGTDPHATLTGGKITRKELLTEAIITVLARAGF